MRVQLIIMTLTVFVSCNPKRTESLQDRFKMSVVKLRNVGLFEEYKSFNDDQLTDSLIAIAKKKHKFSVYDDFEEVYDPLRMRNGLICTSLNWKIEEFGGTI